MILEDELALELYNIIYNLRKNLRSVFDSVENRLCLSARVGALVDFDSSRVQSQSFRQVGLPRPKVVYMGLVRHSSHKVSLGNWLTARSSSETLLVEEQKSIGGVLE